MAIRQRRILAIASGGGHWVQLLRLRPAFTGERVTYATVDERYRSDVGEARFHVVPDATRWSRVGLVRTALHVLWLLVRERPNIIISTGAAPGYIAIVLGRLFGARTVWLDSIANVRELSLSGQRAGKHATLWLTQWPELAEPDGPSCAGAVL